MVLVSGSCTACEVVVGGVDSASPLETRLIGHLSLTDLVSVSFADGFRADGPCDSVVESGAGAVTISSVEYFGGLINIMSATGCCGDASSC